MKAIIRIVFCICVLFSLVACGNLFDTNTPKTTTGTTGVTSTSKVGTLDSIHDVDDLLIYMKSKGFIYENEMEIAGLESGYTEGRKFTSDGGDYSIYRFDETNQTVMTAVDQAKTSNTIKMNVGGTMKEVPVYVFGNYMITYPEGADISQIQGYFQ